MSNEKIIIDGKTYSPTDPMPKDKNLSPEQRAFFIYQPEGSKSPEQFAAADTKGNSNQLEQEGGKPDLQVPAQATLKTRQQQEAEFAITDKQFETGRAELQRLFKSIKSPEDKENFDKLHANFLEEEDKHIKAKAAHSALYADEDNAAELVRQNDAAQKAAKSKEGWAKFGNGVLKGLGIITNLAASTAAGYQGGGAMAGAYLLKNDNAFGRTDKQPYPNQDIKDAATAARNKALGITDVSSLNPVTGVSPDKLNNKELYTKVGDKYYNKSDVDKLNQYQNQFGQDDPRAGYTSAFTNAMGNSYKETAESPEFQETTKGWSPEKKQEYLQSKARGKRNTINNFTAGVNGNPLVDYLRKHYGGTEISQGQLEDAVNLINLLEGTGDTGRHKDVMDAVLHGGKIRVKRKDGKTEDISVSNIDSYIQEMEGEKGAKTNAQRSFNPIDFQEVEAAAPTPESGMMPPPGVYNLNPVEEAKEAHNWQAYNSAKKAEFDYNLSLLKQANGLVAEQNVFEMQSSVREFVNENKHLPEAQLKAKWEGFKQKFLTNPVYSPNAPGLTQQQALNRAQIFQQVVHQGENALQQAVFETRREDAALAMSDKLQSIVSDDSYFLGGDTGGENGESGERVFDADRFTRDVITAVSGNRYLSRTQAARAYGQVFGQKMNALASTMLEDSADNLDTQSGQTLDVGALLGKFDSYTAQIGGAAQALGAHGSALTQAAMTAKGALRQGAWNYNAGIIADQKAKYDSLKAQNMYEPANLIAQEWEPKLTELYKSGGISADTYHKAAGDFKLTTTTALGTKQAAPVGNYIQTNLPAWLADAERSPNTSGDLTGFLDKGVQSVQDMLTQYNLPPMNNLEIRRQLLEGTVTFLGAQTEGAGIIGDLARLVNHINTTTESVIDGKAKKKEGKTMDEYAKTENAKALSLTLIAGTLLNSNPKDMRKDLAELDKRIASNGGDFALAFWDDFGRDDISAVQDGKKTDSPSKLVNNAKKLFELTGDLNPESSKYVLGNLSVNADVNESYARIQEGLTARLTKAARLAGYPAPRGGFEIRAFQYQPETKDVLIVTNDGLFSLRANGNVFVEDERPITGGYDSRDGRTGFGKTERHTYIGQQGGR